MYTTFIEFQADRIRSRQQVIKEIGINHATIQTTGSKIFIKEDPREKVKQGKFLKMPMMTGVTKDEGSMVIEGIYAHSFYVLFNQQPIDFYSFHSFLAFVDYIFEPKFYPTYRVTESQIQYLKNNLFNDFIKFNGK